MTQREGRERRGGRVIFLRDILVKGERAWKREGKGEQGVDFSEPPLNERCKAFKLRIKK